MSVAQELSKVQAQLEAASLRADAAAAELAGRDATIAEQTGTIAERDAQIAAMQGTIDGAAAAQETAHAELTGRVAEMTAQVETLTAENADLKRKLTNPAFKIAAIDGEYPEAAGGGGEGAQAGATPLCDAYKALTSPAEKRAFWEKNFSAMQDEQRMALSK
jgi:chromosome segregation ATPase